MRAPRLAVLAYAGLLALLAVAQAADVPALYDALLTYDLPALLARGLAVAAIVAEGGAAAGLVLALARPRLGLGPAAGALGTAVAAGWVVLGLQALLRGLSVPNAGWLGATVPLELGWPLLAVAALAVPLSLYAWRVATRSAARAAVRAS